MACAARMWWAEFPVALVVGPGRPLVLVDDSTEDIAPATAVVIGAGFIGLEMAENLVAQGIDVTIVETPQVPPLLES